MANLKNFSLCWIFAAASQLVRNEDGKMCGDSIGQDVRHLDPRTHRWRQLIKVQGGRRIFPVASNENDAVIVLDQGRVIGVHRQLRPEFPAGRNVVQEEQLNLVEDSLVFTSGHNNNAIYLTGFRIYPVDSSTRVGGSGDV